MQIVRPFSITEIKLHKHLGANISEYGNYKVILLDNDDKSSGLLYFGFADDNGKLFWVSEENCKIVVEQ